MMKARDKRSLLPAEIRAEIPALYSTEGQGDARQVVAKFFYPRGVYTFFLFEGQADGDDFLMYGYTVMGMGSDEEGYTSLGELESFCDTWGLGIERDKAFTPKPWGQVKKAAGIRQGSLANSEAQRKDEDRAAQEPQR